MKISKILVPAVALMATYNPTYNSSNQVEAINCEVFYENCCNVCRALPATDLAKRALCWSAAATAYGACLAGRSFGGGGFGFGV
jgi:hypothetical protein